MVCGRLFASPVLLLVLLHVCKPFRYVPLDPQTQKPYHYGTLENGIVGRDISWERVSQWQYERVDTKLNDNVGVTGHDGHQNDRSRSRHSDGVGEVVDDECIRRDRIVNRGDIEKAGSKEEMDTAMEDRRGLTKKPMQVIKDDEANQKVDELLKSSDTSFLKILKSTKLEVLIILSS